MSSTQFVLHEHVEDRSLCPVTYFLALALADGVFEVISDPSQFSKLDVPSGRESLILPYKLSKVNAPIFQSASSPSRVLTVTKAGQYLVKLGTRAGYGKKLHAYNFRRGQAQTVDG